jgi:hypothetical protein
LATNEVDVAVVVKTGTLPSVIPVTAPSFIGGTVAPYIYVWEDAVATTDVPGTVTVKGFAIVAP